jgi:hypothetical protein
MGEMAISDNANFWGGIGWIKASLGSFKNYLLIYGI